VQFRLDVETFALVQQRVTELRSQGTLTTVNLYCRGLFLSALGQSKDLAFADEIALMAHASKHRVARLIGELLEEHMETIVQAALTEPDDG
jgi:hypothetical protein